MRKTNKPRSQNLKILTQNLQRLCRPEFHSSPCMDFLPTSHEALAGLEVEEWRGAVSSSPGSHPSSPSWKLCKSTQNTLSCIHSANFSVILWSFHIFSIQLTIPAMCPKEGVPAIRLPLLTLTVAGYFGEEQMS